MEPFGYMTINVCICSIAVCQTRLINVLYLLLFIITLSFVVAYTPVDNILREVLPSEEIPNIKQYICLYMNYDCIIMENKFETLMFFMLMRL